MSGELVVGGSTIPGEYVLPALLGQFKLKYPDISLCLRIGSSQQVSEWVDDGRVEVGVVGARPAPRTLVARELMEDELVVVVPADHPWSGTGQVRLADVEQEPLLVRERGSGSRETLEPGRRRHGARQVPRGRGAGLDPGDQAGGARRRRRRPDLQARGGGRVPGQPALVRARP